MKRMAFALVVFLIVVGFAVSGTQALGQQAKAAKGGPGGGGGNGGGDADPLWVLQLFINDAFNDGNPSLRSDRFIPPDPDPEVPLPQQMEVLYQDYRLPSAFGDPDPCAQFNLSTDSSPGRARLLLSRRFMGDADEGSDGVRCDLTVPTKARTFTLVFDKSDSEGDPNSGGACACAALEASLSEVSGPRKTTFVDDMPGFPFAGSCALGLAAGEIYWPNSEGVNDESSQPQIIAWPYEEFHESKKGSRKARQSIVGATNFNIHFHTDSQTTDANYWSLFSQGEIVAVDVADGASSLRTVTSDNPDDRFTLRNPDSSQCTDVSMTFQVKFYRFDVSK